MSVEDICSYLNSLREKIDDLSSEDTLPFFRSFFGPHQIDMPLDVHFDNFVATIKSLRSWIDTRGNVHLSIDRIFTQEESISMTASQNVDPFVWALGYKSFGCGLKMSFVNIDNGLKTKSEAIYFLQAAFQNTHPHVRTLQSMTFQKVAEIADDPEYVKYVTTDNPSFTSVEKLTKTSFSVSSADAFFYDEHVEKIDGFYSGPSRNNIKSFIFTSTVMFLDENCKLYQSSERMKIHHGILIHNRLRTHHKVVDDLLWSVFSDLGKKSRRIDKAIRACPRFIGIAFKRPLNCKYNKELLCDIHLAVIQLKRNKYSQSCNCRECFELDAGYEACLYFVDRAVLAFQIVKKINIM